MNQHLEANFKLVMHKQQIKRTATFCREATSPPREIQFVELVWSFLSADAFYNAFCTDMYDGYLQFASEIIDLAV